MGNLAVYRPPPRPHPIPAARTTVWRQPGPQAGFPSVGIQGQHYAGAGFSLEQLPGANLILGDTWLAALSSPSGYFPKINSDGTVILLSGGDNSRQSIPVRIFHRVTDTFDGPGTVWINEVPPIWNGPIVLVPLLINVAMVPVNLNAFVVSTEGDTLTFSLATGGLPPGIVLSAAGILSGTPTSADGQGNTSSFPFSVFATDNAGSVGTTQSPGMSLNILVPGGTSAPVWTSLIYLLPDQIQGQSINLNLGQYAFSPAGLALTFSVASGSPPPGTTIDATGLISGTFTTVGIFTFVLEAIDSNNNGTPSNTITMQVIAPGWVLLQDAVNQFVNAGFIVSQPIQHQVNSSVPAGYVISQSPLGGSSATPGTPVFLVVSDGPGNVVTNPVVGNYVGLEYRAAQRSMALNNLGTSNPVWQNSLSVPGTIVISQSIAPGTPVAPGTIVTLTVSMGPLQSFYSGSQIVIPNV